MSQLTDNQIESINEFVIDTTRVMIEGIQEKRTKASELPSTIIGAMRATKLIATAFVHGEGLHPRIVEMITLQVNANVSNHFSEFIGRKFGIGLFDVAWEPEQPKKGFSINHDFDPSVN